MRTPLLLVCQHNPALRSSGKGTLIHFGRQCPTRSYSSSTCSPLRRLTSSHVTREPHSLLVRSEILHYVLFPVWQMFLSFFLSRFSSSSTPDKDKDTDAVRVYSLKEIQAKKKAMETALITTPAGHPLNLTPHYDRNFITAVRAMNDFLLNRSHLTGLRVTTRRSPNEVDPPLRSVSTVALLYR